MSMFSKSLIKPLLISTLLSSGLAIAQIDEPEIPYHELNKPTREIAEFDSSVSGFIYGRYFTDNEWHENMSKAALNLDMVYGDFAASMQVSTDVRPIRRATLTYSNPITQNTEVFLTGGVLPRIDSFFNNATDNPGTSGMALLPFAGYNYRMQTGTFTLLKGGEIKAVSKILGGLVTTRYSHGEMYIDDEKELNKYLFSKYIPTVNIETPKKSYDYSLHYETEHSHLFHSKTHYTGETSTNSTDRTSLFITNYSHEINYDLRKYGIKLNNDIGWIQGEYVHGISTSYSKTGVETYWSEAKDFYVMVGVYLNAHYQAYWGHSHGDSDSISGGKMSMKHAEDSFFGVTRETGVYAVSVEYHKGHGRPWMKYGATGEPKWEALVVSGTYRF